MSLNPNRNPSNLFAGRFKKSASAKMTKEIINGKYGNFEAYIIRGDVKEDTYNIKEQLKGMGFKWYNNSWWISSKKLNDNDKISLSKLGVISSEQPNQQTIQQPAPPQIPVTPQQKTENEEMSKWYGFPINSNIYNWEEDFEVDGQKHHAKVTIDRSYQKGITSGYYHETKSREHKGLPKYLVNIVVDGTVKKNYAKISDKKWGTYNEAEFLDNLKTSINEKSIHSGNSKLQTQVKFEDTINRRTPEYKIFLNDIDQDKIFPTYDFHIDDPVYGGNYKLGIYDLGMGERAHATTLKPIINDPNAPKVNFHYQAIDIFETYTIQDFHNKVQTYINTNREEIQNDYIEYLKSFPFLPSQKQEATGSLDSIKGFVTGENRDANEALNILQNKGYIRPHKRQKQSPGLSKGEEINWVIDSKKIVNDAYNMRSYASRIPDYFYTVLAYYIHRKVRGIWSWTDMMLIDVMNHWFDTMKQMGATFTFDEVEKSIENLGNTIVNKIYGETKEERNKNFFNWFYNGAEENKPESTQFSGNISEFANFAKQYGIDVEDITEENAKNIYRTLTKLLHPDLQQDPNKKIEMTEKFKELQNIWDKIPEQFKKASNWFERSIIS